MPRDPYKFYPHDYLLQRTLLPLIPAWVKPNQLTFLRLLSVPFVVWFFLFKPHSIFL
jgi:phosphatidylglycerophosphate synthase